MQGGDTVQHRSNMKYLYINKFTMTRITFMRCDNTQIIIKAIVETGYIVYLQCNYQVYTTEEGIRQRITMHHILWPI